MDGHSKHLRGVRAADEVVAGCTSVSDAALVVAVLVKDDSVGARRSTSVDSALQNWELVPWRWVWEGEALVIVVLLEHVSL